MKSEDMALLTDGYCAKLKKAVAAYLERQAPGWEPSGGVWPQSTCENGSWPWPRVKDDPYWRSMYFIKREFNVYRCHLEERVAAAGCDWKSLEHARYEEWHAKREAITEDPEATIGAGPLPKVLDVAN